MTRPSTRSTILLFALALSRATHAATPPATTPASAGPPAPSPAPSPAPPSVAPAPPAASTSSSPRAGATATPPTGPAPVDASAFTWEVQPRRIVLGETPVVSVTLRARGPDHLPLDVAPPRVTTSTGTLGMPERTAPGTWRLAWTPPTESFPHVAVLVAALDTAKASAIGFVSLQLWGKGSVVVKTKPKSQVTLRVGNEVFGPVRADDEGGARVAVVAPPGAAKGLARSVDEAGNVSEEEIGLGVPPFNRVALAVVDDVVPGDGTGVARLVAVTVDEDGAPRTDAALQLKSDDGEIVIDAAHPNPAPGLTALVFRPKKTRESRAVVDVALAGAAASRARANVQLVPGRAARASIALSPEALSSDEPERKVSAQVKLVDEAGRSVPAQAARLDVSLGHLSSVTTERGVAQASWLLPPVNPRQEQPPPILTVRLPSGEILGTAEVKLVPGAPAKLAFDEPATFVPDGQTPAELVLRVIDRASQPVTLTKETLPVITVDPTQGRVQEVVADGPLVKVRVVPTVVERRSHVSVRATLDGLSAATELPVLRPLTTAVVVAPGVAIGSNYQELLAVGPEVSALVRLPALDGNVHVGGSISLLQSVLRPEGVDDHRALPLLAEVAWRPAQSDALDVHIGLATGLVLSDLVPRDEDRHVVELALAGQLVLGAAWPAGPGLVEVMLRGGTAAYLGSSQSQGLVGLPAGATVILGYRLTAF